MGSPMLNCVSFHFYDIAADIYKHHRAPQALSKSQIPYQQGVCVQHEKLHNKHDLQQTAILLPHLIWPDRLPLVKNLLDPYVRQN